MARSQTRQWFYGLAGGFIAGGASAVTSATGLWAARSVGMDVPLLNLKAMAIVFLSAGVFSAMAYLKQSPLPPEVDNDNKPTK